MPDALERVGKNLPVVRDHKGADDLLKECWRALAGGRGDAQHAYVVGLIDAFRVAGVLTATQASLWVMALDRCPGHGGGQVWCAYCGEVCKFCQESGACYQKECVERYHAEADGRRCPWCGKDRPCATPRCVERRRQAGFVDHGVCPDCGGDMPCADTDCVRRRGPVVPTGGPTSATPTTPQPAPSAKGRCTFCNSKLPCRNEACPGKL
jgi:hypothetical protein